MQKAHKNETIIVKTQNGLKSKIEAQMTLRAITAAKRQK